MSLLLVKTHEAYLPTILVIPEREKKICTRVQEHTKGIPKSEKPTCKIICITSNPDVLEKETELRSIRLVLLVHLLEDRRIWRGCGSFDTSTPFSRFPLRQLT